MSSGHPPSMAATMAATSSSRDDADGTIGSGASSNPGAGRPSKNARKHRMAHRSTEGHDGKAKAKRGTSSAFLQSPSADSPKQRSRHRSGYYEQEAKSRHRGKRSSSQRGAFAGSDESIRASSRNERSPRRVQEERESKARSRRPSSSSLKSDDAVSTVVASRSGRGVRPKSGRHYGSSRSIGNEDTEHGRKVRPMVSSSALELEKLGTDESVGDKKSKELEEMEASLYRQTEKMKQQNTTTASGKDEVTEARKSESFCSSRRRLIVGFLVILLVVASGFGAYFGTRPSASEAVMDQPSGVLPTQSPEIDVAPTPKTVTSMPTATPTEVLLFDPPTPEDCSAISNGGTVVGQEDMPTKTIFVDLDVTLSAPTELGILMEGLKEKIQEVVVPELAGCVNQGPFFTRGRRRINDVSRYAIANAAVDVFSPTNGSCTTVSGLPCYRVAAAFDVSLKGDDVKILTLIGLLSGVLGVDDSWVAKLGLGATYESIAFENIYLNVISESPSLSPTTSKPTVTPSAAPTTPEPTKRPSSRPTNQPSSVPSATDPPTTDAPTPLPTATDPPASGNLLTYPSDISSSGGLLSTTLTIAEASYTIPNSNIRVNSRLLNGEFPGPTFRIKPGDTLQVTYNNDLADQGIGYVHNTYSGNDESNVHFHGLHVSGELPSDDTTYSVGPGESYNYMTTLPSGHMPGTHWLHPHRHGSTSLQVGGGAMLAIIVEDEDGTLPSQVQNAREVLFIAQYFNIRELESVIRDSGDGVLSFSGNTENEFVTVNGQLDPMIQVDAGEWFRLRVVWANFLEGDLDLRIPGCEMQLLAKDGIYIRDFPREISEAPVPSGGRADIMVRCPDPSTRYTVSGIVGGFATVVTTSTVIDSSDLESWTPDYPEYLTDLRGASVNDGCRCETELRGREVNSIAFPSDERYLHVSYLGAVVERTLNSRPHPYHQHVYPFQLIGNGFSSTYNAVGDWQDVVKGSGAIRFSPTEFTGKLMLHCHRLVHEDRGMMAMEFVGASGSCSCTAA